MIGQYKHGRTPLQDGINDIDLYFMNVGWNYLTKVKADVSLSKVSGKDWHVIISLEDKLTSSTDVTQRLLTSVQMAIE